MRRSTAPLWRVLHHLQGMVSRRFNRARARTGGLWQSRYQAKLVDEERYLVELVLCIHSNPVRAGLVADPRQHGWSGHREILEWGQRGVGLAAAVPGGGQSTSRGGSALAPRGPAYAERLDDLDQRFAEALATSAAAVCPTPDHGV